MNCPSRTDEVDWNPGWNQNPPFLSADLTTCQDLNGMINARELNKSESRAGKHAWDESIDDAFQSRLQKPRPESSRPAIIGWAWWILSVFCTSFVFSNIGAFKLTNISPPFSAFSPRGSAVPEHRPVGLSKRATCATGGVSPAEYDMPLHVGALFIILFVSTSGCAFPMLVLKFPRLRIPASFLFAARHFGTGVLISTAFVHLLPTAFLSLGDPCLSSFWTEDYPAMPGAIALAAVFLLTLIEMAFSPGRSVCSGSHGDLEAVTRPAKADDAAADRGRAASRPALSTVVDGSSPLRDKGPLFGRSNSFSRTLTRIGEESKELDRIELAQMRQDAKKIDSDDALDDSDDSDAIVRQTGLTREVVHKKAVLQVMLLEMGILFHSIFIGMALSVSIGSDFIILLIAIIFHQTFEGLALGARIASLEWRENALQPWVMAFAYGCTTPIGQAIGLATHTLYSPDSEIGLLVVGIMNAISAGLLVFASLVELLSEDFLSDESWRILRGKRRVVACVLVFLGAFLMALVGAWA